MAAEACHHLAPVLAVPLIAGGLLAACSGEAQAPANAAAAPAAPKAATPVETAQRLVRERVGGDQALTFTEAQVFDSAGATIVCGRVARPGQANQRYIAIGEEDLFLEGEMEPGHMDRAAQEYCRNA